MPNAAKIQAVADLKTKLEGAVSLVLTQFTGLTVADITSFRRSMDADGVEFHVVKNTLLALAAREAGIDGLEPYLSGPTAVLFGHDDAVAPARVFAAFSREHRDTIMVKAGLIEGKVVDGAGVMRLATLPPREVLLAQTAAGIAAPLRTMASLLSAPLQNLAYGLAALAESRSAA